MMRFARTARAVGMLFLSVAGLSCTDGPRVVRQSVRPPVMTEIPGMPGPEDLVVDTSLGRPRLLVSSVDRTDNCRDGAIFEVDLRTKSPRVSRLRIEWRGRETRFRPHGIALLPDPKVPRLFVVNHGNETAAGQSIEVFDVGADALTFHERIRGSGLVSPNDLDVRRLRDGSYELFVSNPAQGWRQLWEAFIGPHSSFVARFQSRRPQSTRIGGLRYANGVLAHSNGRLYVSSSVDRRIYDAPIDAPEGDGRTSIEIDAVVDNLTLNRDNTILVAASGSVVQFVRHARAALKKKAVLPLSPTEVWRVRVAPTVSTELLFRDSGKRISGGSAAVCVDGDLFIGQVFGDFVLRVHGACRETA